MKKIIVSASFLLVTAFSVWANDGNRSSTQMSGEEIPATGQPTNHRVRGIHNILSDQLPAGLRTHIKEDYKGYWITELYEETDHKQSTYTITLEDAEHIIKLKATDDANWVVTDTIGKEL